MNAKVAAYIEQRKREGKQCSKAEIAGLEEIEQRIEAGEVHPWYGPCDSFGPAGDCSECARAKFVNERDWERWLQSDLKRCPTCGAVLNTDKF